MFSRFNIWFDHLPDTKRFLIFLAMVMPGIIATGMAERMESPFLAAGGMLYLCALLLIRVLGK